MYHKAIAFLFRAEFKSPICAHTVLLKLTILLITFFLLFFQKQLLNVQAHLGSVCAFPVETFTRLLCWILIDQVSHTTRPVSSNSASTTPAVTLLLLPGHKIFYREGALGPSSYRCTRQAKSWKAPHPECWTRMLCLTAQGVMKTEDTKGFCTRFQKNPSWADNLSTSLSTKAVWDLQTSCPSWRVWFIWYALSNLNACQVFIHSHGILHNTRVVYLLRKW